MPDVAPAGPTEILVEFDALDRVANLMRNASTHASVAQRSMAAGHVSPTAFGLMNVALGTAVTPIVSHTRELAADLDDVFARLDVNTKALAAAWREVEAQAADLTSQLAKALSETEL